MWLLTSPANKQILCSSKEDMFAYMELSPDIPWTIRHVPIWVQSEPKPKAEKYERPFKPMSQE